MTIEIHVYEFSPAYIFIRRLLPAIFYSETPVSVTPKNRKLINDLLSVISEACEAMPNQDLFGHILQAVFDLLENDTGDHSFNGKHSAIAYNAAQFIWEHYCEDISVSDVARNLSVSKNHLEKIFINMYGIGVASYIRIIRVYQVMFLLRTNTERSVLDIAFSCGFNSSSGFYKAYQAVVGKAPRRTNELHL